MHYAAALIVRRQLEPLNLFLGFEQANRYSIEDDQGQPVAYLAEEETTFSSAIFRQLLRTHRPFKAVIMDSEGRVMLKLQRPWTWINTHINVLDANDNLLGQVMQQWHLWRRRYELFIDMICAQRHEQFAQIDAGFLAWRFELMDEEGKVMACIDRRFGGFAREIFTDTGQYALFFHPDYLAAYEGHARNQLSMVPLTGDQRAVVLACAIGIDFDYFSRHSHGGMMGGGG
ncbi:Scramblase [Syncephalis pseudoplumigaleata]|uniref:Phospholipid scramblase n=1 Tax=Syncephalis pseudoplumigaleata TaxID=1712513 RepID=A0A4P9YWB1_9FUNG|nr:Scramblase [Syncephalis pseudoplumigaleata]|eukprot:RKP24204.1 Scramblase [Syncephalis pseudoplumigaleata]